MDVIRSDRSSREVSTLFDRLLSALRSGVGTQVVAPSGCDFLITRFLPAVLTTLKTVDGAIIRSRIIPPVFKSLVVPLQLVLFEIAKVTFRVRFPQFSGP